MSTAGLVAASTLIGVVAVVLVTTGLRGARPSLARTIRALRRPAESAPATERATPTSLLDRVGAVVGRSPAARITPSTASALRIIDRTPERHLGYLVAAGLGGLVAPALLLVTAVRVGDLDDDVLRLAIPAGVGLLTALLAPLLVHSIALERAAESRMSLRHQLSAFVDMVTMLLAGNAGHEGALRQAAGAGDGRLFRELRRRMREVGATGRSLVDALDLVAADFDLPELTQIAATGRLAAAEGAPVARSLAAKCSTLRSTLAADQEAEARVRTDKVTPPLVGMTVLFMAVIIFPALDL